MPTAEAAPRRKYDNTLRREQSAETRERIASAASEILHSTPVRDWEALTVRAAAERAGVNERTVYRHFGSERGLRDAAMQRLEKEADIDLEGMRLEDVANIAARIFRHVTSFPFGQRPLLDPTLSDASHRQHEALLGAVARTTKDWSSEERVMAAGVLDVLWSVATYERLVGEWQLEIEGAVKAVAWVIGLVHDAVVDDRGPADSP